MFTRPARGSAAEAGVTTTSGGVSSGPYASLNLSLAVGDDPENVMENRRRLAMVFGASPADFVFARQVHAAGVHVVTAADRGRGTHSIDTGTRADGPEADALVTRDPGVVLAILAADCVPIVLADPVARVLACVHAGWRGTVARAAAAAVAAMVTLGARPENVVAGIGPAVAADRYQVGAEVKDSTERAFSISSASFLRPDGSRPDGGRWLFDLPAANRHVLREAGVPDSQIHVSAEVTGTDQVTGSAGRFFSDREARPCGRHALVARLRAA
jgi:YfiH family protein